MSDREEINLLLDYYGVLLTEHQRSVLSDYYMDDLSMQEIAENMNVSKAAVSDLIRRSVRLLYSYEEKMHLLKQREDLEKLISAMKDQDDQIMERYIRELERIKEE